MSKQLISFTIENCNYDKSNKISNQFYNNSLLEKSKNSRSIIECLHSLTIQIDYNTSKFNGVFSVNDFGDINMKHNDPSVQVALLEVGQQLLKKHCLSFNEITYYFVSSRYNFLKTVTFNNKQTPQLIANSQFTKIVKSYNECSSLIFLEKNDTGEDRIKILGPSNNSTLRSIKKSVNKYVFNYFSVLIIPTPSIVGKDYRSVFLYDLTICDEEILSHFHVWYCIKHEEKQKQLQYQSLLKESKKRNISEVILDNVEQLTANTLIELNSYLPAKYSFITQYILAVSSNDLSQYNISPLKKQSLILRVSELMQNGIKIKDRLTIDNNCSIAIKRQLRILCEKNKIFYNQNIIKSRNQLSFKNENKLLYTQILVLIQQLARNLHGNSKRRGDTPDNVIFLIKDDYQSELNSYFGGVVSRITSVVNETFQLNLSKSQVYNMFPDAHIQFTKSKNTSTPSKIDQHYARSTIKICNFLAEIFSNDIISLSADSKSLINVETAASLKGRVIQIKSEMVTVADHDQGRDVIGKIRLYSILVLQQNPDQWDFSLSEPIDGNIERVGYIDLSNNQIPNWNKSFNTKATEGLGVAYAHNNKTHPETAATNANDISELIHSYLPYFTTNNNQLKSTIFIQLDNGKGPSEKAVRFVFVLMFLQFDLDILALICNAAGFSKYNPAEKVNGGLSNRVNCYSVPFENVNSHSYLSEEEKLATMEKSIDRVVEMTDGATSAISGGYVDVHKASHPPKHDDWQYRPVEIANFLESKDKDHFLSTDMEGFGNKNEVTEMYNAAWRILHSTEGVGKCISHTKHSFCVFKNMENDDCNTPIRGSQQLYDLFKSFGGNIPMPIPSTNPNKQNTDGDTTSPSYSDLQELLLLTPEQRIQAALSYYLPSLIMKEFLEQKPLFLNEYLTNNKTIDNNTMNDLQLQLRASKNDIHSDINHRILSRDKTLTRVNLKSTQDINGITKETKKYFKNSKRYNKKFTIPSLTAFLKDHHQTNYKGLTKPILIAKVYPILIQNNLIQQTADMQYVVEAVNDLVNNAIIAENNLQQEIDNQFDDYVNNESSSDDDSNNSDSDSDNNESSNHE